MGQYRVSVPRHHGHVTRGYAVRKARQIAESNGVIVSGEPSVRAKRSLPLVRGRRAYIVTFAEATRTER